MLIYIWYMPNVTRHTKSVRKIYRTLYLPPEVDLYYGDLALRLGSYKTTVMAKVLTRNAEIAMRRDARKAAAQPEPTEA